MNLGGVKVSKKKHKENAFDEEIEVEEEDLENLKNKLKDLKEDVDTLKKIKRRRRKVNKLQQEKKGILKEIAKVEENKDHKHK